MLEHLDRQDAVEVPFRAGRVELRDVPGHHVQVGEAALAGAGLDELALAGGIGQRRHPRAGIPLREPERQRAPAAAQLEDVQAVGQLGTLGVELQHRVLGFVQRLVAARVVAAGILQPPA
ncbi:hypothetical protein D3C83_51650 [compost metagenome]